MNTSVHWVLLLLTTLVVTTLEFELSNWLNQFQFHVDPVLETGIRNLGLVCRDCSRDTVRKVTTAGHMMSDICRSLQGPWLGLGLVRLSLRAHFLAVLLNLQLLQLQHLQPVNAVLREV